MSYTVSQARAMDFTAPTSARGLPRSWRGVRGAPPEGRAFFAELLAELREHPALCHPFLRRFAHEPLRREQIRAYAVQHYLYSKMFVSYLAAALSSTPDETVRAVIILNMYDEIGEPLSIKERLLGVLLRAGVLTAEELAVAYIDMLTTLGPAAAFEHYLVRHGYMTQERMNAALREAADGVLNGTHPALFRRFLAALGVGREAAARAVPLPETVAFLAAYECVCRSGHWLEALGALGPGTECLVPQLYSFIHRGIANSAVLSAEDTRFWTVHIDGDDVHGDNLLEGLMPYAADAENRSRIRAGARAVLDARAVWYDGLARVVFGAAGVESDGARSLPVTDRSPGAQLAPVRRTSRPAPPLGLVR